ncbi:cytochrome p450 cyp72a219 [Phtheirospermum japonicum]|uniref:Cytochrome p450 cyp72a219 n=1 Tax=Phtheirospermum japonicum TaxID=374723 RepID=A0A830CVL9_9LAMI|nr:cytochrome p450 cyp72a219 [Phtheirospermum japonicum]
MKGFVFKYIILAFVILILGCIVRVVYAVWWKPKSLEKYFRRIGIKGSSYKLMYGDLEDTKKLMAQAWSKPMPLNHSIVPRVNPIWHLMVQKYGKISLSWLERKPRLLIADAGLVKSILNDKNGHFRKPPLNPLVDLLTLGVSTLEGDQWDKRRKLINPSFHHDKILNKSLLILDNEFLNEQRMVPTFIVSCGDLVKRWKQKLSDSEGRLELDIAPEMQMLSSDVIARAAFGTSFEEAKAIFELQKEQAALVLEAFLSLYFPGLRFLPTKKNRRRYEVDKKIKTMLNNMILRKEKKIQNGKSDDDDDDDDDLLSLLLQSQKQIDNNMTTNDVIEECKLFYFAGQETTANWLTWTMIVLSMHPSWQEKARDEVLQVFGKTTPDVKTINQLKIVPMILQEVLRLYPPVTGLSRYTLESTKIGDMTIPPGVELVLPTMLIHHDPHYWGQDVHEFKPQRFARGVSKDHEYHQMPFYPFGWGPRFCLGQNFALFEAKIALTMILQHFSFELSPSYTHAPFTVITLQPQYGAPLVLRQI